MGIESGGWPGVYKLVSEKRNSEVHQALPQAWAQIIEPSLSLVKPSLMPVSPGDMLSQQESPLIPRGVCLGLSRTLTSAWRRGKQSWLLEELARVSQRDSTLPTRLGSRWAPSHCGVE